MARQSIDPAATRPIPSWPTRVRARLSGGRLLGVDNSMWLYRAVPLSPVADAKTGRDINEAAAPLMLAAAELASMARTTAGRRATSRDGYRQIHLLVVNLPQVWVPPYTHPLSGYLQAGFGRGQETVRRVVLLGVKLRDKVGGGKGLRAVADSIMQTLVVGGTPVSDFDEDVALVSSALARCGLTVPTSDDFLVADSWWNAGRCPDVPALVFPEALAFFDRPQAARAAKRAFDTGAGIDKLGASAIVSMTTVQDLDLPFVPGTDPQAWWVTQLLDQDAVAVSVRGLIEPAAITREELRRHRRRNEEDIRERANAGRMERAEQDEHLADLTTMENQYANAAIAGVAPTVVDMSAIVAFNGLVTDTEEMSRALTAKLNPMLHRQAQAWAETMLASGERANPHLHDVPASVLAYSGAPGLSVVGDAPGARSALLGFSERDRQPAWIGPMVASDADSLPYMVVAGATGSGKSLTLLWLADQFARTGTPVIIADLKIDSDHTDAVTASGGQVASLDEISSIDGVFDPIRFSGKAQTGIDLATAMLMDINVWGVAEAGRFEVPLQGAIAHGVSRGATCLGQALQIAVTDKVIDAGIVAPIFQFAKTSALFRACFGVTPGTSALRIADGITLIKAGQTDIVQAAAFGDRTATSRAAKALVRMIVSGSVMALAGRDGVVMLDEAWVFLRSTPGEIEQVGKLARSQRVFPMLFTQRVKEALAVPGLAGYISRGLILPIEDADDAAAACGLLGLDPTPERMARITARGTVGAGSGGVAPNWSSMRALRDPHTGEVLRGSVGIYSDIAKRAVPVEIRLPDEFLKRASTNKRDIDERTAAKAAPRATLASVSAPSPAAERVPTLGWR